MNILICDDEQSMINKYENTLKKLANRLLIDVEIQTYSSGENMLLNYEDWVNTVSVMYLDIEIKTMNGIDLAKEARKLGYIGEIIYLTISKEYVFDSFDTSPMHYLLKNEMTDSKFKEVFLRVVHKSDNINEKLFVFKSGKSKVTLFLKDILYFEIQKRIVMIHHGEQTIQFYSTMDEIQKRVSGDFFVRVHRSYIVNMKWIYKLTAQQVVLHSGEKIPIGRKYKSELQKTYLEYIENQSIEIY